MKILTAADVARLGGYRDIVDDMAETRESRRLTESQFLDAMHAPNVVVLDLSSFKCGHDAPTYGLIDGIIEKVREELDEVLAAEGPEHLREELGDLLLVVVNLARRHGVEAEAALRAANEKFRRRFRGVERRAAERGVALRDLGFAELEYVHMPLPGERLVVVAQMQQPLGAGSLEKLEVFRVLADPARICVLEVNANRKGVGEELRLEPRLYLHGDLRHANSPPGGAACGSPRCW